MAELHRRPAPRLGVGAGKLRARLVGVEERLDGDTQPPVGGEFGEARDRYSAEWLAVVRRHDLDDVLVAFRGLGAADDDLARVGLASRVDVAVAERGEELEPLWIATATEHGHRGLALVAVLERDVAERLERLGRLRVARRGSGEPRHGQQQEQKRTRHQAFFWYVPW
jgi:hypothetical protein